MKRCDLNGRWRMMGNGYDVEGTVPGSVYSFLYLDNQILPDPYYRDNEDIYTRLMEHEYTFERTFRYSRGSNAVSLVFEGLDTLCSIYLNGKLVADTDNMHVKYIFDVSDCLCDGENRISVVCHPIVPFIKQKNKESALFGATDCMAGYPHVRKAHSMMGWDWGPRLPDAGIWRDVYLLEKNSAEITDVHILQRHESGCVYLTPQVKIDGEAVIEVLLTSPDGEVIRLAPNEESEIRSPKLWWPNGLGEQNLYKVTVRIFENGETVDERRLRIGLREMKLVRRADEHGESFYHEINGVDMFAMGADYIPEDNIFNRITPQRTRELLTHCKESNFNALRVWGGGYYPDDFFFDICDELGLVVFFDLMFACSVYEPDDKMKGGIAEEIRQNLSRIRHHACMGLVCGNNEIEWHFHDYVAISGRADREHLTEVYLELFENMIPAIVAETAPYLPYIPSSPTSTGGFCDPNGEACGDCHDWEADYLLCRNRYYRYVSEFGFQSLPSVKTIESFTLPEDRNINSKIMEKHQRSYGGNELILTYPSRSFPYPSSMEALVYASQLLQAESIRYRVEHFRRNRGRCMGTLYWQLNDIWPVTSWASIDYYGRFKALQYAAKRFYSPILLSCEEIGEVQSKRFVNSEMGSYSLERSARFCVTNDTVSDVSGVVRWERRDADSNLLEQGEMAVCVPKLSAVWLDKLIFEELDAEREHLCFALLVDGKVISEGSVLFAAPKHYCFADPHLTCERVGNQIRIRSQAFAKAVMIEGVDGDLITDDNCFDMEKGEKWVRILSGDSKEVSVRSVYDIC